MDVPKAWKMIEKKPVKEDMHSRRIIPFARGREAFGWFLRQAGASRGDLILMPAYIGWSQREGSGVFDPIRGLGLDPVFYRMDQDLHIDLADFKAKLSRFQLRFALIIHYFGFVDDSYDELFSCLRNRGVISIEDSAHALLTDLVESGCGLWGDASIFSLHKILPVETGGMLAISCSSPAYRAINSRNMESGLSFNPWEYNLSEISRRRRRNYEYLINRLAEIDRWIKPLRPRLKSVEIPQSLPVTIQSVSRDDLYHKMNDMGFGVTSLYHTLITEVDKSVFAVEAALSRSIMNLPIHQDVTIEEIDKMLLALKASLDIGGVKDD